MALVSRDDLAELERRVRDALDTGDESGLDVIGYGEVTTVLRFPEGDAARACKRLPRFRSRAAFDAYGALLEQYIADLRAGGVDVVDTELHGLDQPDASVAAFCVQALLPADTLGPRVLAATPVADSHPMFDAIAERVVAVTTPEVGIDAQMSNWAWDGTRLRYLDVTTPFVRTPEGSPALDLRPFTDTAPALLRSVMRRWVLPGIIARWHDPRYALLDAAGNFHKERLERWLPAWLAAANAHVAPPITGAEAARFYKGDARTWATLMRIRYLDRSWQRRVRRRPYPVLLPGPIER